MPAKDNARPPEERTRWDTLNTFLMLIAILLVLYCNDLARKRHEAIDALAARNREATYEVSNQLMEIRALLMVLPEDRALLAAERIAREGS